VWQLELVGCARKRRFIPSKHEEQKWALHLSC
jgi:hypothetical protein